MSSPDAPANPLAAPEPWDLVSSGYAEELAPRLRLYAEDALQLAGVSGGARVLDVACGAGPLAILAARRGASVDALDFAARMIDELRSAIARDSIEGVTAWLGDGQALPFGDGTYDAAFSMFGLMFFPDRARGFAELRRCLKEGGVAVVSSWLPMETVPFLAGIFAALRARMPGLQLGSQEAPLSNPERFAGEMTGAGFREVAVHEVRHTFDFPSTAATWTFMLRTMAPLTMLSRKMGPSWAPVGEALLADLLKTFGSGAQSVTMPAWLGAGRR